ncbi:type I methionyl aminopeptidase [Pseudonocardia sp. RS11V-5]|uniref:type I methionyl aminopeptidase n=1 Tax=Pseudonocardia terrae TaxID=2905831 RepID=UPI001E59B2D8|nr:type I methionyl aminopeptidase [Pseudonocardia terrae]MCE3552625.1 type I methionyl aminopeptidase [Pseudonocardia terrae]
MIELKTPGEIDAIDAAGSVVARILAAVRERAAPGVRPSELDALAADMIAEAGAVSSFRGYHPRWAPGPYPGVLCVSVNDAVVHGIPSRTKLRDGDLLSVDFAVHLDGWCADAAFSMVVGSASSAAGDEKLIATTEAALQAGIDAAQPGAQMGDVGHAIGQVARGAGYGMLADHGGHGVGRSMHEEPHVPNEAKPRRGVRLRPGLVIAIEPMLHAGGRDSYRHDRDGWTIRTADGSRAAHAEHTIAITENGPRILTLP